MPDMQTTSVYLAVVQVSLLFHTKTSERTEMLKTYAYHRCCLSSSILVSYTQKLCHSGDLDPGRLAFKRSRDEQSLENVVQ